MESKLWMSVAVILSTVFAGYGQSKLPGRVFENDDLAGFQSLMAQNDWEDAEMVTLLTESITHKVYTISNFLKDSQLPLNLHNHTGATPLTKVVQENNFQTVKNLLAKGANPSLKQNDGLEATPLMLSHYAGTTTTTELLLDHGADVSPVDVNLDSPVNWAAYAGTVKDLQLLIAHGANLSLKSKHGDAADVALRLWHADSVAQIFRSTSLAKPLPKADRQLFSAVQGNHLKKAERLLGKEEITRGTDVLGVPFLLLAAQQGNLEMVRLLVKHGADPDPLNRVGQTALTIAVRFGHADVVEFLVENGSVINGTGTEYMLTPIMAAAVNGNVELGRYLIQKGADINTKDVVNQCNALHWAIFYNNDDLAEMLLQKGVDYKTGVLDEPYNGYSLAKAYDGADLIQKMDSMSISDNPLLGSWKLEEIHYKYQDTTYVQKGIRYGRILFHPNTYAIMYNPRLSPRSDFKDLSRPTDKESLEAFRSIAFNSGVYHINENVILTISDLAKVPGFEGGKQYYRYAIDGTMLEMVMFDETYPGGKKPEWYGKLQIELTFKKE